MDLQTIFKVLLFMTFLELDSIGCNLLLLQKSSMNIPAKPSLCSTEVSHTGLKKYEREEMMPEVSSLKCIILLISDAPNIFDNQKIWPKVNNPFWRAEVIDRNGDV